MDEEKIEKSEQDNENKEKRDIGLGSAAEMSSTETASVTDDVVVVQAKPEQAGADKKKKKIIAVVTCVLVAIIAVIVIVFAVKSRSNKPETDDKSDTKVEVVKNDFGVPITDANGENMTRVVKENESTNGKESITNENGQRISQEQIEALQEATTKMSSNVGTKSDNDIVIQDTGEKPETLKSDKAIAVINDFLGGTYYLEGAMYAGGEGNAMTMSVDGANYEILANLDSIEIAICRYGDRFYMKRPASKQYCELNDSVLDMIGMSKDDITIPTGSYDMKSKEPSKIEKISLGGKAGVCYTYKTTDNCDVKFYFVDDTLRQIDNFGTDGTKETEIKVDEFSKSIPSDQMTLKGYKSAALGDMLADVIAAEG